MSSAAGPDLPPPPSSALTPPEGDSKKVGLVSRVQEIRSKYARWEAIGFFTLGFAFDILTLDRIDSWLTLVQQAVYLVVLGTLLAMEQRYVGDRLPPSWLAKVWRFSEDALHFLFGSLLSTYTLFYFKSASGITSLLFLVLMALLLVANEAPRFRQLGPVVRVGLFSFCVTSYFAYVIPVLIGFLSAWLFVIAALLGTAVSFGLYRLVKAWSGEPALALRRVALPGLGVQALLVAMYFLRVIPPVPLAMETMGIYHGVERLDGEYRLLHERDAWRVWEKGDQKFKARPGDKVYCFVRIFAPSRFRDRVFVRWSYDDPKRGWVSQDAIPLTISGGRAQGFRGYASKANYMPGDWRVSIETEDGREVGRIRFTLLQDDSVEPREFSVERG